MRVDLSRQEVRSGRRRLGRALPTALSVLAVLVFVVWGVEKLVRPAGGAPGGRGWGASAESSDWYRVEKRSFTVMVPASGELEAKDIVEVKCAVEGRTTIIEVIEEGTTVEAGEVLVRLADDEIVEKVDRERLSVEEAVADEVAARQMLSIRESEAKSQEDAAVLALRLAELDLAKWEKGTDPQSRRELTLRLEKAKRTLVRAKRDLELSHQLYEEKFISLGELEDDQIAVIEAENELATAELAIDVYEKYTRPKELRGVQSAVEQASAELDRMRQRNESDLSRSRAELHSKKRTLELRRGKLTKLEEQWANTVIRAPQEGMVVYGTSVGSRRKRKEPIAQGRQVRFNETLIVLPDTRRMVAALKVHEALVPKVAPGQRVAVSIDAMSGEAIEGVVSQIAVMAEDGGWLNPDLREYVVRVDLPQMAEGLLKPAMRCSGQIVAEEVVGVLAVPLQGVWRVGQESYCYLPDSGGLVRRVEVVLGRSNESFVEVLSGLDEADQVLLRKPKAGEVISG